MEAPQGSCCLPWFGAKPNPTLEQKNAQLAAQVSELQHRLDTIDASLKKEPARDEPTQQAAPVATGVSSIAPELKTPTSAPARSIDLPDLSTELAKAIAERDAALSAASAAEARARDAEHALSAERARAVEAEKRLADADAHHRAELAEIQVRLRVSPHQAASHSMFSTLVLFAGNCGCCQCCRGQSYGGLESAAALARGAGHAAHACCSQCQRRSCRCCGRAAGHRTCGKAGHGCPCCCTPASSSSVLLLRPSRAHTSPRRRCESGCEQRPSVDCRAPQHWGSTG